MENNTCSEYVYKEYCIKADQYYQAQAEALEEHAQKMLDNGTNVDYVRQWFSGARV